MATINAEGPVLNRGDDERAGDRCGQRSNGVRRTRLYICSWQLSSKEDVRLRTPWQAVYTTTRVKFFKTLNRGNARRVVLKCMNTGTARSPVGRYYSVGLTIWA